MLTLFSARFGAQFVQFVTPLKRRFATTLGTWRWLALSKWRLELCAMCKPRV